MKHTLKIALMAAVMTAGMAAQTASAGPNTPAECVSSIPLGQAKWQYVVNFDVVDRAGTNACLATRDTQNNIVYKIYPCDVKGDVTFGNGSAAFKGGLVACPFDPPGEGVEAYPEFEIYAKARNFQDSNWPVGNAIFSHTDVLMAAPTKAKSGVTSWMDKAFGTFAPIDAVNWTTVWAKQSNCAGQHSIGGVVKNVPAPCKVSLSLNPQTIYIGYDQNTGDLLQGELNEVTIDPQFGKGD